MNLNVGFRYFFAVLILLFSTIQTSAKDDLENYLKQAEVNNVVVAVSSAELSISSQAVTKSCSWTLGFISKTDIEIRKKNLINKICRENNADILIDPHFEYRKRVFGGGKLTVTGYPAKYVNFRSLSKEEVEKFLLDEKKNIDLETDRVIVITKEEVLH